MGGDARADWQRRVGRRSDRAAEHRPAAPDLVAPPDVTAAGGAGHVTLSWATVPAAIGYVVERARAEEGPFLPVDTGPPDVGEVPGPPFCDTTGPRGGTAWYRVAAIVDRESAPGPPSPAVCAAADPRGDPVVEIDVDVGRRSGRLRRLWHMIGAERLSQLVCDEQVGGRSVATEFADALALVRDGLGVTHVRAHAILHDDLGVYSERGGEAVLDFAGVDAVYDRLLRLRLRPVVELSFMPHDLAREPEATVFAYRAIVSPPKDWGRWATLVHALTTHLVDRYGIDEVRRWPFEVWNEPNLEVFWAGTQAEYLRLYDTAVAAVRSVDASLLVGGPATAASGWLGAFLDHVADDGVPLDAVTTHTYGNVPLDLRPALAARGLDDVVVWWTEWGVDTRNRPALADSVYGAPFVLHGMKRAQATVDRLAYWVASDHFEELGRPASFLHGGFGLLTVGNVPKPRFRALQFAEELADDLCAVTLRGDGAGGLVDAWAARHADGSVDVLIWNATLDHAAYAGDPALDRRVRLFVDGLEADSHDVSVDRIDLAHGDLAAAWTGTGWPTDVELDDMASAAMPEPDDLGVHHGPVVVDLHLPMPGVARVRCRPLEDPSG